MKIFDTAIIGAGPAGMMAAVSAGRSGRFVIIVEKNKKPGRKLLLTGNGRCNICNYETDPAMLTSQFGPKGAFLFSALNRFGLWETIDFFESAGLSLKTEDNGRMFPKSDRAGDVLSLLIREMNRAKVETLYDSPALEFEIDNKTITGLKTPNSIIRANRFILCTGGKSWPRTGSDGSGYRLAQQAGHKIILPRPALSPVKTREKWVEKVKGLSFDYAEISIIENDRIIHTTRGSILFTHFGLSGPAVLNCGKYIPQKSSGEIKISIDLFPGETFDELEKWILGMIDSDRGKRISNILSNIMPSRFSELICEISGTDPEIKAGNLSKIMRKRLVETLKNITLTFKGFTGFEQAMGTSGGVDLDEIDPYTMKSRIVENLYFAGEVIDLDGPTGGYNLQICWSTGYLAGRENGKKKKEKRKKNKEKRRPA